MRATKLRTALSELGFNGQTADHGWDPDESQHRALICNLYISGILSKENIWESINVMGGFKDKTKAFKLICGVLETAGAFQPDINKFHHIHVLDNLFEDDSFDQQDIQDFILYWRQFAFARKPLQERNELQKSDWMQDEHRKQAYINNSTVLGLLTSVSPLKKSYHETWVMGASYPTQKLRIEYLKAKMLETGFQPGQTRFLAGKRELTVGLDGKEYMLALADKLGIKYDSAAPTVKRQDGKDYLNYTDPNGKKLYESDMVADVYQAHFGVEIDEKQLIDSDAIETKNRPDTVSTSLDAADKLIQSNKGGVLGNESNIQVLVCSNQPYIRRQTMAAQEAIDQQLNANGLKDVVKITACACGPALSEEAAKASIAVLHSDGLGALGAQQYKALPNAIKKRDPENLMYQSREKVKETFKTFNTKAKTTLSYVNNIVCSYAPHMLVAGVALNCFMYRNEASRGNYIVTNLLYATATALCTSIVSAFHTTCKADWKSIYDHIRKDGVSSFVERVQSANFERSMPAL